MINHTTTENAVPLVTPMKFKTEAELLALFDPWERGVNGNIVPDSEANALTALRLFGATVHKYGAGGALFVLRTRDGKQTVPKTKTDAASLCCAITFKHFGFYPRIREMKRALVTASNSAVSDFVKD
ncbi:hypothetical protein [Bradyrhizobium manausense]|uniref:Uncharacterized protein n=1 Tax=Bradyrhizobium manausense TaxID=989370 RepID=A0A0R3D6K0_9BRAD|nr:hypothetical protein [Bradyrhizobium manausense]KRQ03268.1 hypothetical protein AOQ71_31565 [Bradyrhizobium manausense]